MYVINEDNSIYITRGDILAMSVTAEDKKSGKAYKFKAGDIVRINIHGRKECDNVVLQKDFPVAVECDAVDIFLTEKDTKIGESISKPKDYWYEVVLNPDTNPQTIIGYDDDNGPIVFKLFPEGGDIEEDEPITPEDIPIVDGALDISSERPVENKAIAREIIRLEGSIEDANNKISLEATSLEDKINQNNTKLSAEISVERARITNLTKLGEGSTTGDAELQDIRVGANGKVYDSAGESVRKQLSNIGGKQILPELIESYTDDLTVSYTDGKFATSYKDYSAYDGLSCGTANITGYESVVVMCYVDPSKAEFPVVFCTSSRTLTAGAYTEWETIDKDLGVYKIKVPLGATLAKFNIYTNKKEYAYCKGVEYVQKHLDWLKVEADNIGESAIKKIADIIKPNADIDRYKYGDSLNKPFDFNGKRIVAFGDSITAGTTSPNLQSGTPYIKHFADRVGAALTNRAVGGTCIADADITYSIYNRVLSYTDSADFIFVAGGTNDFNTNKELGSYSDTSTDTFYGCLRAICEHISKNFADSEVIFITPIPYTSASRYHNVANDNGYTLNDYRNAIYEIATLYEFNVVDGNNLGMPDGEANWSNDMCDDGDGCHPSAKGHKLYAKNLAGKLC